MSLETIRLSNTARNQLITLKRRTGIKQWNELCRWALCRSLAEPSRPNESQAPSDGVGVEMTWKVFAGAYADIYAALLEQRALADGVPTDDESLGHELRLHLHRGIAYLMGDRRVADISGLTQLTELKPDANTEDRAA